MHNQIVDAVLALGGFVLGGVLGFVFGTIQRGALLRNLEAQRISGRPKGGNPMAGSFRRTAFLLLALVLVQVACPMFFESATIQWIVSAGVVVGYGWTLLKKMKTDVAYNT